MEINIIAFGQLAELTAPSITVKDVADTSILKQRLEEQYPALQNIRYVISVNHKIMTNNTTINESSIVALLPPFSGG